MTANRYDRGMAELRELIRQRMDNLGVSQVELAKRTGLKQPTISQYLSGRYELTGASIERIVKALDAEIRLTSRKRHK